MKKILYLITGLISLFLIFSGLVWFITFHPEEIQSEEIGCAGSPPLLQSGQRIKVISWNVQYMAGKNYCFFYESGRDARPSPADVKRTTRAVAEIIREEDPDIILLQEVDVNAKRTGYRNQIEELLTLLPDTYRCRSSAYYWKAAFVPHPKIMGRVGMKLVTISKYRIDEAVRHQLPLIPENPLRREFNLKRAVLEVRLPLQGDGELAILNTHLSAFAQGTDTMKRQVAEVKAVMDNLSGKKIPWIAGGDFNLLPPGPGYSRLSKFERSYYRTPSRLKPIYDVYRAVPSLTEVTGEDYQKWYTHFPNNPLIEKPDKTIDYIFHADDLVLGKHYVRNKDTLTISDHLPVVAELTIP